MAELGWAHQPEHVGQHGDGAVKRLLEQDLLGGDEPVVVHTGLDCSEDRRGRRGLLHEPEDLPQVDRLNGRVEVCIAGQEDTTRIGSDGARLLQEGGPIHVRHAHVGDDAHDVLVLLEPGEPLRTARRGEDVVTSPQGQGEALEHPWLVIDAEDLQTLGHRVAEPCWV